MFGFAEKAPPVFAAQSLSAEDFAALRLIRSENIGCRTFYELLRVYGTATAALEKLLTQLPRSVNGPKRTITLASEETIRQEIQAMQAYGAQIITLHHPNYPEALRHIADAPPVLTALGDISLLQKETVAIVGARNASASGCRMAYKLAEDLGEAGYVISSGLARGIDTAAHKASVPRGTIAVIAGGIDSIYPPENKDLYHRISKEGLILAELAFGSVPHAQHFPQRNRIISGLSKGVVIVEAAKRSGSLVTARFAAEQGRDVFAVPGSPLDARCAGPNGLIKDGATLVESAEDILHSLSQQRGFKEIPHAISDTPLFAEPEYAAENGPATEDIAAKLYELLSPSPVSIEQLIEQLEAPASLVRVALLELELSGAIDRHPGDMISLRP